MRLCVTVIRIMNTTYVLYCGALITLAEYKAIIAEQ
nr:MAG TPA: hypothetical protein [Caudoviricetes sp.]